MQTSYFILGRQPKLGLAELESLYGAGKLRVIQPNIVEVATDPDPALFRRLGGSIKLARQLDLYSTVDWSKISAHLISATAKHAKHVPSGKLTVGLSTYGLRINPAAVNATALSIKKSIRSADKARAVRIVPNKDNALNSAQVLHNDLTSERGWELLLIRDGDQTILAQAVAEQDIEAYSARDQKRPMRDARVGMLPPKLAQIIINLANPEEQSTILDPFCGTGVILQEAYLMGFDAVGSDNDNRMIEYSEHNLRWLLKRDTIDPLRLLVGDATSVAWPSFDAVACETYLGRPFSVTPKPEILPEVAQDVGTIHKNFLRNLAGQTKPGFRMCIAVPAWKVGGSFKHLAYLDHLEKLGYTRKSFVHVENKDLIYHREGQIVARELVVLQRK